MVKQSWGVELWDQFDNISKYTEKSIQFCERYESFLKDRCTVEDEYAKALKKLTKTYAPKSKEQEEFYNKYSYTISFCSTLKELQDIASQHELIAENLRERSIKPIQLTIKECRDQRKKCLEEYNKIKRQLDKQHDLLIKSLRKYEEYHESARRAKESYEKAHEDLDLSRAQLEKARDTMTCKSKICDDAHATYSYQVSLYNDIQRLFYEKQLPSILNELQQLDEKRLDEMKIIYTHSIQSHIEVLPRIQACLDEMTKQTEQLNSNRDEKIVIDEYKSGYTIPDDEKVIDFNAGDLPSILYNKYDQQIYGELNRSNTIKTITSDFNNPNGVATIYAPIPQVNGCQTLTATAAINTKKTSGAASTIKKIFGSSTQRKPSNISNSSAIVINTPYSTLPPAQRLRKFQEQILNCKNELEKKQKAKEGLMKMKLVFKENPKFGDEKDVTLQIQTIDDNIEKLLAEIKRFESYIYELERVRAPTTSDIDIHSRPRTMYESDQLPSNQSIGTPSENRSSPDMTDSNGNGIYEQAAEFHCLPSVSSMIVHQTDTSNHDPNGSFEEEIDVDTTERITQEICLKAYVLYDFTGLSSNGCQYVNAVSIYVGESVDILENDRGDGWTRIKKTDGSTGFVPSTYLRIDTEINSTSLNQIESGRF